MSATPVPVDLSLKEQRDLLATFSLIKREDVLPDDIVVLGVHEDLKIMLNLKKVQPMPTWTSYQHCKLPDDIVLVQRFPKQDAGRPLDAGGSKTVNPVVGSCKNKQATKRPPAAPPDGQESGRKNQCTGKAKESIILNVAGWGTVSVAYTKAVLEAAFKDAGVSIELYTGKEGLGKPRFRCTSRQMPIMETAKEAVEVSKKVFETDIVAWIQSNGKNSDASPLLAALIQNLKPVKEKNGAGTSRSGQGGSSRENPHQETVESIDDDLAEIGGAPAEIAAGGGQGNKGVGVQFGGIGTNPEDVTGEEEPFDE